MVKNILLHIIMLALSTSVTFARYAGAQPSLRMQSIQKQLSTVLYQCPNRVWPQADWSGDAFVLLENGQAYALAHDQLLPTSLTPQERDQVSGQGNVYAMSTNPEHRIIVRLAEESEYPQRHRKITDLAVQIAQHEGFHLFQQVFGAHSWQRAFLNHSLDPAKRFPFVSMPYYQFQRLIENLQIFIVNSDSTSLAKAKFWYLKLRSEYPYFLDEITGGALREGSAVYVELVGAVIAKQGCNASEDDIFFAIMKDHTRILPTDNATLGDTSFTTIMYYAAPYIYLAIRKLNRQDQLLTLPNSGDLFSLLFEHVSSVPDEVDKPDLLRIIDNRIDEVNSSLTPNPMDIKARFMQSQFAKISVTEEQIFMETSGPHLRFRDGLNTYTTARFRLGGNALDTALYKYDQDPCGTGRLIFLIENSSIQKGQIHFDGGTLGLEVSKGRLIDGQQWYCL